MQRLLLGDAADFVCRILFVMGIAASPHGAGFGDEPALSQGFADCMDALAGCREALRKLQGGNLPAADVLAEIGRCATATALDVVEYLVMVWVLCADGLNRGS